MIAGIMKLLPLLNKAIDLVPDKNKITEQKADLEKELLLKKSKKEKKNYLLEQLSLELGVRSDISVKIFNLKGQLVDVIAEGSYAPNAYNWTWNAENLASGVYLVRTQVGSNVDTQKIMLLK